jgi:hypothetical protein
VYCVCFLSFYILCVLIYKVNPAEGEKLNTFSVNIEPETLPHIYVSQF